VFAFQKFMLSKNRFSTSEALKAGGSLIKTEPRRQLRGKRRPSNFLCATGVQVPGGPILDEAGKNIAQTVALELVSQIPDLKLPPIRQELKRALAEQRNNSAGGQEGQNQTGNQTCAYQHESPGGFLHSRPPRDEH